MTPELKKALEKARSHVMTPEEKFEQRVSFVYGQQDHDKPGKSKDEIRQMIIDREGYPACNSHDALIAENKRLREALGQIADTPNAGWMIARAALGKDQQ